MKPLISLIIPIFNSAEYLSDCLDSVLGQTFKDFEAILVNDGSTDNSDDICKAYAERDKRIKYIRQENQGVCAARNTGLDNAEGEMICFADSDDWMEIRGLEILYNEYLKTGADLVVADLYFDINGKRRRIRVFGNPITTANRDWIDRYEMACIGYGYNPDPGTPKSIPGLGSLWNKLYKKKVIDENNIRFDPYVLGIYEDNLFVLHYLEHCRCVSYIPEAVYFYRKVGKSNSRGFKQRTLEINYRIFERIGQYISEYKSYATDDFNKALSIYVIRRLEDSLEVYFFAEENSMKFALKLRELNSLIRKEPYKTAIRSVDPGLLRPRHKLTWLSARTRSAFVMFLTKKFCDFAFDMYSLIRR